MKKIFNWDNLIALIVVLLFIATIMNIIINLFDPMDIIIKSLFAAIAIAILYLLKKYRFKNYPKFAKWLLLFLGLFIMMTPYTETRYENLPIVTYVYDIQKAKEIQQYANEIDKIVDIHIEFFDKSNTISLPSLENNYVNKNYDKYFAKAKNHEIQYQIHAFSTRVMTAKIAQKYANDDSVYIIFPRKYENKNLKREKSNIEFQYASTIANMDGVKGADVKLNDYNRVFKDSTIIVDIEYNKGADTKLIKSAVEKLLNSRDWKTQINLKEVKEK